MRILVFSDTHGDAFCCRQALVLHPEADAVIHCGDSRGELEMLKMHCQNTGIPFVGVRGNCDWSSKLEATQTVQLGGKTIFVTHGHLYQAKFTFMNMIYAAREANADILLFGHTHQAVTDYQDGLYIMNPGSCGGYFATYGMIDITPKGDVVTTIAKLKR